MLDNPPASDRKAERKARRERRSVVIWLADGVTPITSAGVVAIPMSSAAAAGTAPAAPPKRVPGGAGPAAGPTAEPSKRAAERAAQRAARKAERAARKAAKEAARAGAGTAPHQEPRATPAPPRPALRRQAGDGPRLVLSLPDMGLPPVWDTLAPATATAADGTFVPPEVEQAGQRVMQRYDMAVSGMKLITAKPDKGGAIWRIETDKGPRSLKLLHREAPRSLFSIGAQDYLVGRGARVPALVRTRSGELAVQVDGKLWIVTDWIEPLAPATKVDLEGAAALCYGLGEFHRQSQGYVPPFGAVNASRLYRWPKTYEKILTKIGWFRELARAYQEQPAAPTLLSIVDMFEQQARDAIARLEGSAYTTLVARGEQAHGIVHQDYGWSNGQIGPGGVWLIDLDGVAFDLPIRDLRKLIASTMDDMGAWDLTWIRGMIDAYHQANPIEPDLYQVLLIDMSLPNEFYKHVKAGVTKTRMIPRPRPYTVTEVGRRCTLAFTHGSRPKNRPRQASRWAPSRSGWRRSACRRGGRSPAAIATRACPPRTCTGRPFSA